MAEHQAAVRGVLRAAFAVTAGGAAVADRASPPAAPAGHGGVGHVASCSEA